MSRGPGRWQREILRVTSGVCVATVSGIVRARLPEPHRDAFVAARRGARGLALAQRVSAVYVWGCTRCNQIQDRNNPQPCCGTVRPMLAVARPERRHLLVHPAPAPGGSPPAWISAVPATQPAPAGLLAPGVDDLARLAARRLWEALERSAVQVSARDVTALLRLAHETGRERAPGRSDEAWQASVRQLLWLARSHLGTNWPAFVRDVRTDRHLLTLWGDPPEPGS